MSTPQESVAEAQLRLAEQRTEQAEQRTSLAEERTYSAWVRTGLAAVASGFAIAKLHDAEHSQWAADVLGVLFLLTGGAMFLLAFLGYRQATRRVGRTVSLQVVGALSMVLTLCALLALLLVLMD